MDMFGVWSPYGYPLLSFPCYHAHVLSHVYLHFDSERWIPDEHFRGTLRGVLQLFQSIP